MDAAFFAGLLKQHFGTLLVAALVLYAWWKGSLSSLSGLVAKLEHWYDRIHKEAEDRQVYSILKRGYDFANDEGRRLAAKTNTTVDDKVIEKGTIALAWVLKALTKAGLAHHGDEDLIKGHFGAFHEAEQKAKDLHGKNPFVGKSEETSS